jgi:uncharacterized protein with HEPN domain
MIDKTNFYVKILKEKINKIEKLNKEKDSFLKVIEKDYYYDILIKNLVDLGEESKNLNNIFKSQILRETSKFRNELTHMYFNTSFEKIDDFLENSIPILKKEIEEMDKGEITN